MRISDWSSDVCSSDLWAKVEAAELFRKGIEAARRMPASSARDRRILRLELELGDVLYAAFGYVTGAGTAAYHRSMELSEKLGDPEAPVRALDRSEEHTSELQSLMRITYAVFCLKKKKYNTLRLDPG